MFNLFDIVPDPATPQVTLIVTKYTDKEGNFLCVPIIGKEYDSEVHVSAMRFIPNRKLIYGLGKIGIPAELTIEIENYILKNERVFKNRIDDFDKIMSENRDKYPSC